MIDAGPRLNKRYHSHRNATIVHGDAHIWNAFLPKPGERGDVRIFDWDSWRVDMATDDLAYMMALHWYPDLRRSFERPLLDHYHAELVARGVNGYDRRALDDDYRLSVLLADRNACVAGGKQHSTVDLVEQSGAYLPGR